MHVFHEGMFAKLYNESAFLFTEHVRRYKVNVTDCKRGRYYSLGFPFFALDEVFGENSEWIQTEISEEFSSFLCTIEMRYWEQDSPCRLR